MGLTRRSALGGGLAALALGASRPARALGRAALLGARGSAPGDPLLDLGSLAGSVRVGGLPFAPWFTGDDFADPSEVPFHYALTAVLPSPEERVDVAIVGGGLSGLTTAYQLRHRRPVLFDLRPRFGGNALGEAWGETRYSLGSAYVITTDEGSFLEGLYAELGLPGIWRESAPPDPIEVGGVIDSAFWSGLGLAQDEARVFRRYAEVVTQVAEEEYPEIPLPKDPGAAAAVRRLDATSFREDLERRMGVPLTTRLAAAVQSYFYSSFGAGMELISAASGWNFLAAEEYGRLVFPAGNAGLARALWSALAESALGSGPPERLLRPGCRVVDVRRDGEHQRVTWIDQSGRLRALLARQVVMAGAKQVVKHVLHGVEARDPRKFAAMAAVETMAYVVANVLLDAPVQRDFYDLFLIGDEHAYPMTPGEYEGWSRPTDVLNGNYSLPASAPRSALTLYWPLAWFTARFSLLVNDPFERYSERAVDTVRQALGLLGVSEAAVRQVRLSRWGHALPLARPGFIAAGHAEALLRPFDESVHFVNQDNWALPAVENSLLDAEVVAARIDAALG